MTKLRHWPRSVDFVQARLALRSELSEIARLNLWLEEQQVAFGLDADVAGRLKLCLNEVAANVVTHGYPDGGCDGRFEVTLTRDGDVVTAYITDDAMLFDPTRVPQATPITGLDDAVVGGFGIKLIRETADEMAYGQADSRNKLALRFELSGKSPRASADP